MKPYMFGVAALGVVGAVWFGACGSPASIDCTSQRGGFAAKYTLQSGTGACALLKGERVGLQKYNPPKPGTLEPDVTKATLAIRTETHGQGTIVGYEDTDAGTNFPRTDPNVAHDIDAVGEFTAPQPDSEGLCYVPTLSEARQEWPILTNPDGGADFLPAATSAYTWKNVRLIVTPNVPGSQFEADLTYTGDGSCVAEYKVSGVFPATPCGDENDLPDNSLCTPEGGSHMNPDFAVTCDPDLLMCVLTEPIPSLK
jgi:hypothetical protein